jgi:SAM-dependent methyltransferase
MTDVTLSMPNTLRGQARTKLRNLRREGVAAIRDDYLRIAAIYGDKRPADRLIAHYTLERQLADLLRRSTKEEREAGLYTELYDILLSELDDHPRKLVQSEHALAKHDEYVARQTAMIRREARADDVFLEVGGGDCRVALKVAPHVARSIVVDVSDQLVPSEPGEPNFRFVKTQGVRIPLPDQSVSFIYSNQLMEHLHPEDAQEQLFELFRVLKAGGRYLCRTPHRATGPHDISRYFDDEARGMHLREYSCAEIDALFREAGFVRLRFLVAPRALQLLTLPRFVAFALENLFAHMPRRLHTRICRSNVVRALLGITLIAEKPA